MARAIDCEHPKSQGRQGRLQSEHHIGLVSGRPMKEQNRAALASLGRLFDDVSDAAFGFDKSADRRMSSLDSSRLPFREKREREKDKDNAQRGRTRQPQKAHRS
jgi:hypothetical protein